MDDWESLLRKLIQLPVTELHLERGREIKQILEDLSRYPFDPICKIKNIKEDRDLARDELRGAAQRYVYGNYLDSILFSCFSVEYGLLIRLNGTLSEDEKKRVPKPFTLGKIISCAYDYSILDQEYTNIAKKILKIRNTHIHVSNFISGLILSYKSNLKFFEKIGVTLEAVEQGIDWLSNLPGSVITSLLGGCEPSDIAEGFKAIQLLSSFEWCGNIKIINSTRRETDEMISDVISSFLRGDFRRLKMFQGNLLKQRALRAIEHAHMILKKIDVI